MGVAGDLQGQRVSEQSGTAEVITNRAGVAKI